MRIFLAAFLMWVGVGGMCSYGQSASPPVDPAGRAKADIQAISMELKQYMAMNDFYPTTEQGLEALVTRPTTDPKSMVWRQLMDKVPVDPWGHAYLYKQPGVHNPETFDVYSAGPDGKPGTADDIGNW